jgi:hypothetical protein
MRAPVFALVLLAVPSCLRSTTDVLPDLQPRSVREVLAWSVSAGDRTLGRLGRLRIEDAASPEELYFVQNNHGQWVGWIDDVGRVFRREPFHEEDVFVTTTTVQKGVALLLNASAPVELVPVEPKAQR